MKKLALLLLFMGSALPIEQATWAREQVVTVKNSLSEPIRVVVVRAQHKDGFYKDVSIKRMVRSESYTIKPQGTTKIIYSTNSLDLKRNKESLLFKLIYSKDLSDPVFRRSALAPRDYNELKKHNKVIDLESVENGQHKYKKNIEIKPGLISRVISKAQQAAPKKKDSK